MGVPQEAPLQLPFLFLFLFLFLIQLLGFRVVGQTVEVVKAASSAVEEAPAAQVEQAPWEVEVAALEPLLPLVLPE